jgi:hypothetical protein
MPTERDQARIGGARPAAAPGGGFFARVLGFAAGVVLLVGAFVFSLLLFAVLLAVATVAGAYLWWKTRKLRQFLRENMQQRGTGPAAADATVLEGEYSRVPGDATGGAGRRKSAASSRPDR